MIYFFDFRVKKMRFGISGFEDVFGLLDLRVNKLGWSGARELRAPPGGPALSVRPALVHVYPYG